MMKRFSIMNRETSQSIYLKELARTKDEASARLKAGVNADTVRQWRKRYPDFLKKSYEILSRREKALRQREKKRQAEERKAARKVKVVKVDLSQQVAQEPVTPPTTGGVQDGSLAKVDRGSYEKIAVEHSEYLRKLKGKDYQPTDEPIIAIAADSWATIQTYNAVRFRDDYHLRVPVHSTSVLECNPFETDRRKEWSLYMDCLRKLGLTHETRDYKVKKKASKLGDLQAEMHGGQSGDTPS